MIYYKYEKVICIINYFLFYIDKILKIEKKDLGITKNNLKISILTFLKYLK